MNAFYKSINWPELDLSFLINRITTYPDYINHQDGYDESKHYGNLKNWPGFENDISPILNSIPLDDSFKQFFTLQFIKPPGLEWHIDRNRAVSILYLIDGEAYTYFRKQEVLHGAMFEKNCWYLFNNKELHSVKKLEKMRVALCIDLTDKFKNYDTALIGLRDWL